MSASPTAYFRTLKRRTEPVSPPGERFSLNSLRTACCVGMLGLSLMGGMLLSGCRPAEQAGEAEAVFRHLELSWEEQFRAVQQGRSRQIVIEQAVVTSAQFQQLSAVAERLAHLEIYQAELTAEDRDILSQLQRLEWLRLEFPVDAAWLRTIGQLPELRILNLPRGSFGDEDLAALRNLPHLELLRFSSPQVTDAGLQTISQLPSLRFLHLIDVPITDGGLQHLTPLTQLESFYLDGGHTTDRGLEALLTALPELHLHKDQLHLPTDPQRHDQ